jgi:hypothetical protein
MVNGFISIFRNVDVDIVPEDKNKFIQVIRPLLVELVSKK